MAIYGLRLGLIAGALLTLCTATVATASTSNYQDEGTVIASAYADGNVLILSWNEPTFALPAVIEQRSIERNFPAYRPYPLKQRASGTAIRPTSLSGWRSGRVRTLAT